MKKILFILLLSTNVWAVTPAPTPLPPETPSMDVPVNPMPPVINELTCPENWFKLGEMCYPFQFTSHLEAEQHYYHCALGVHIWGDMIKRVWLDFNPIDVSSIINPLNPFICYGFELYPDSQLCSKFQNQYNAELNYAACQMTNFQYWDLLQQIKQILEPKPIDPQSCKRFREPNIYKAQSETQDSAVLVMSREKYCLDNGSQTEMKPLSIILTDQFGNTLSNGRLRHCNKENNGRIHYDFPRGTGAAFVNILFPNTEFECFYIPDRSRNQR